MYRLEDESRVGVEDNIHIKRQKTEAEEGDTTTNPVQTVSVDTPKEISDNRSGTRQSSSDEIKPAVIHTYWGDARWGRAQLLGEIARGGWVRVAYIARSDFLFFGSAWACRLILFCVMYIGHVPRKCS